MSRLILDTLISKHEDEGQDVKEQIILTRREKEVLHYIAKGFSNQEIADTLKISSKTIDTHKSNLMQKMNIKSSAALARFVFDNDFLLGED